MKSRKKMIVYAAATGLLTTLVPVSTVSVNQTGNTRFFRSPQFHYQAARALGHAPYQGAAPGEALAAIGAIKDGDVESWFSGWSRIGTMCARMGEEDSDPVSQGYCYLRASNYYRAAEFFLDPKDNRRIPIYTKSVECFQKALARLQIKHRIDLIPYENGRMRSYYFPGSRGKPVVMIFGGYDSTNEESFFWLGYPLIRRNYPVILFEGPGQSDMIRRYGIRFTPDWHRPVGTVIDYAESKYPELHSRKKVLVGISLGGILAGRAAALEKRIGAVMLFGSPFSFEDSARNQMPAIIRYFYDSGRAGLFNTFAGIKKRFDLKLKWGLDNGLWCIGGTTPFDFVRNGRLYTLADVESRITCPVLVFYGEKDMYVADGIQDGKFQNAFRNSKEYTIRIFRDIDGSAEHCQIGAGEQAVYYFTSWLRKIGFEK